MKHARPFGRFAPEIQKTRNCAAIAIWYYLPRSDLLDNRDEENGLMIKKTILAFLLLFLSQAAFATITAVTSQEIANTASSTTTVDCNLPSPVTTGNFVVVVVNFTNTRTLTSIKDNAGAGTTYSLVTNTDNNANRGFKETIGYLANVQATTNNNNIRVTISGSGIIQCYAKEFAGVATSSPLETDAAHANTNSSTSPADPTVTTVNGGDLYVAGILSQNVSAVGSGWTAIGSAQGGSTGWAEWRVNAGSGMQSIAFTTNSSQWASVEAAFMAAASFTPGVNIKLKKMRALGMIP